jgi:hypothetical protein
MSAALPQSSTCPLQARPATRFLSLRVQDMQARAAAPAGQRLQVTFAARATLRGTSLRDVATASGRRRSAQSTTQSSLQRPRRASLLLLAQARPSGLRMTQKKSKDLQGLGS